MKRIVILIDGTWNKQAVKGNTNVAKLDPLIKKTETALIGTLRLAMVEGDKVDWSITIEHHGGAYDYSTAVNGKTVGRGTGTSVWDAYINWR